MKKIILALLVLALLGLGYYFFSSPKPETKVELITAELSDSDLDKELELSALEEEKVVEFKEDNLSLANIDKELKLDVISTEVEPEMVQEIHDIMVEASMEEVEKAFPSKEGIKPVAAVEFPKNSVKNLKIGDTVSLPYMGNGQFNAKITSKTTHKNDSVSVSGKLVDENQQFTVVLTEGKNMTFGTVTTPNGSFEIETRNGQGYVYATDEIDREWIDHSQSDTLIPSEHDHH